MGYGVLTHVTAMACVIVLGASVAGTHADWTTMTCDYRFYRWRYRHAECYQVRACKGRVGGQVSVFGVMVLATCILGPNNVAGWGESGAPGPRTRCVLERTEAGQVSQKELSACLWCQRSTIENRVLLSRTQEPPGPRLPWIGSRQKRDKLHK